MDTYTVTPIFYHLSQKAPRLPAFDLRICVPGSKSLTNRALMLAALADGDTTLQGIGLSDDSRHFIQCLIDLGFTAALDEEMQQITISGSTALSDDEVDRMVKDAEAHAEEDKRIKEEAEVRNNCDSLVNATEQTLRELGDKVPADAKSQAEGAIEQAKTALQGTDIEAIKSATEALQEAGYKLAEIVYSQNGAQGASGFDPAAAAAAAAAAQGAQSAPADDGTIEADYEVVDPDEEK